MLGVSYESAAVHPDGTTAPEGEDAGTEYLPDGRSTLDVLGEWFTLFTADPGRWSGSTAGPWPVHVEALPAEHLAACGIGDHGAVLVRPDGHVAARWSDGPAEGGVRSVLADITAAQAGAEVA